MSRKTRAMARARASGRSSLLTLVASYAIVHTGHETALKGRPLMP